MTLKSIARCRCVSKRWASILRRRDFTELFFTKSLARPQLLIARRKENEIIFFSSPQPQNCGGENVSRIAADHRVSFPVERVSHISSPVNGYVCISDDRILKRRKIREVVLVICNPSTRHSFTLPRVKTRKMTGLRSFLGYDPVEKQHKVLAMIRQEQDYTSGEHQVLTLRGNGNLTWRMTECGISHSFPREECVCINGVLYYTARVSKDDDIIVCFDVRSEKFSFVNFMETGMLPAILLNFQGKLASVRLSMISFLSGTSKSFEMWILEDPEKHEWCKRVFNLPPMWKEAGATEYLYFVGVSATNESVISPLFPSNPFHVYYYNFVKEALTKVVIQGIEAFEKGSLAGIFLNHVADVKLM